MTIFFFFFYHFSSHQLLKILSKLTNFEILILDCPCVNMHVFVIYKGLNKNKNQSKKILLILFCLLTLLQIFRVYILESQFDIFRKCVLLGSSLVSQLCSQCLLKNIILTKCCLLKMFTLIEFMLQNNV